MDLGEYTRASGPKDRIQDTNESLWLAGTSTSTQPSRRFFSTLAPETSRTAHQATFGLKATRARAAGWPSPHGPACRRADASNPSGGDEAGPISLTGESRRESLKERTSPRVRSRPARYQCPPRNTNE